MITKIAIKNFKSIKSSETELTCLNLLVGLNGMGKTSFLQAIMLLVQSEKLADRVLDLNGIFAQIGQGRDALYQFADEKYITIELQFDAERQFCWAFRYQSDREKLTADSGYKKELMDFFNEQVGNFQYVCAERLGPRDIYDISSVMVSEKKQFGLSGEYAACYVNVYGLEVTVPERLRHPKALSGKLIHQLNAWMQEVSPGVSINTKTVPEANKVIIDFQFEMTKMKTNSFRPKNVGFGISYVLPVILSLLSAEKGKIIVMENPESHIHPRGQVELGKLIALAASIGAQLFVETHSDHIINGIRVAVKEQMIDHSQVNILFFDKETSDTEQYTRITKVRTDKNGTLSDYPKGFLDEWSNQLLKLI